MRFTLKTLALASVVASSAAFAQTSSGTLFNQDSTENLASFEGGWTFESGSNLLTLTLKNTGGGVLTALAFDRPDLFPSLDSFSFNHQGATDRGFSWLLGPVPHVDNSIDAPPLGNDYDHLVSTDGAWLGGAPQGITSGETASFVFDLADSTGGTYTPDPTRPALVLRFQGIPFGAGSDKVAVGGFDFYTAQPVPEPETYAMMLAGLSLLFARKLKARKQGSDEQPGSGR